MNVFPSPRSFAFVPRIASAIVATFFLLMVAGLGSAQTPAETGKENLSDFGRAQNDKTLVAPVEQDPQMQFQKEYELQLKFLEQQLKAVQDELKGAKQEEIMARSMAEEARARLGAQKKELTEREQQFAQMLAELERNQKLPPIENGAVVVFKLEKYPAQDAAKTVQSLLGAQPVRFAIDERTNSLIAFGKQDALPAVEELVRRLDEQEGESSDSTEAFRKPKSNKSSRSLLVRVFWLADGVPADEGQDPAAFLPHSVLAATHRLGLVRPRLVTQTVNSLAVKSDEPMAFNTAVPAVVGKIPVGLNCEGRVKLIPDNRVDVEMKIDVSGPISCSLSGSLASPLGHYMVLGTATSVISEAWQGPGMMGGRGMGMEGGAMMGRGGYGGGYGMGRGGYGGEMSASGGEGAIVAEGGMAMEGAAPAPPPESKYSTSRFAFVVQVIDGQSYPAEDPGSDAQRDDDPFGNKPDKDDASETDPFGR